MQAAVIISAAASSSGAQLNTTMLPEMLISLSTGTHDSDPKPSAIGHNCICEAID
jgi:hypothetical protein